MIKRYATFDANGNKTGGWLSSSPSIPENAVEINAEDANKYDNGYIRSSEGEPILNVHVETEAELILKAQEEKIYNIKKLLFATDYIAIKFSEGVITAEQFEKAKTIRATWRMAIHLIEAATTLDEVNDIVYTTEIPTDK